MRYCTKIIAMGSDGEFHEYAGPIIEAISPGMAQLYCEENGLGYCQIDGELISIIPCNNDCNPDFCNEINYDIHLN